MSQNRDISRQDSAQKGELVRVFLADGTITYVNSVCCDFYEKTMDEMIGSNLAVYLSEDERDDIIAAIFSISQDNPEVITRPRFTGKDGKSRYLEYRNRGIFQADGTIVAYQSVGVILAEEERLVPVPEIMGMSAKVAGSPYTSGRGPENEPGFFSDQMREIRRQAEMYHHDRSIPVLIEGETGVGKEIIAKLIHFGGTTSLRPFVDINCTAITPSLFESELFGYDSGAFTGAVGRGKHGKLDCARGGTLFLDEVAEIPTELQAKLLRVLEEKAFYRVGGLRRIHTDIRVVAATNVDFDNRVADETFRRDLYYRLRVGHIRIPALRERREDILPLAGLLLNQSARKRNKRFADISDGAARLLLDHPWPGNIRELKNLMEWVTFMFDARHLAAEHITDRLTVPAHYQPAGPVRLAAGRGRCSDRIEISKAEVQTAIDQCGGNKTQAARRLGISIRTLYNRLV